MMKRNILSIAALGMAIVLYAISPNAQEPAPRVHAMEDGLAFTPPMGWYPWNTFGQEPQNEKLIREIVDALVASA